MPTTRTAQLLSIPEPAIQFIAVHLTRNSASCPRHSIVFNLPEKITFILIIAVPAKPGRW